MTLDDKRKDRLFLALVVAAIGLAGWYGYRAVHGLQWPAEVDLFRDMSQAIAARSGHPFADAQYHGELSWYTPLVPWIVALVSLISRLPVHVVEAQSGTFLNLIAPIGFVCLAAKWFGRRVAGFALIAFLFVVCANHPSWIVATYSPWLFVANFAQGVFYFAVIAVVRAFQTARRRHVVVAGLLSGALVLTHAAPALMLGAIAVCIGFRNTLRQRNWKSAVRIGGAIAIVAFAASSVFVVPVLVRYRFHIRNHSPSAWVWDRIEPKRLTTFLRAPLVRWPTAVIVGGSLVGWLVQRRNRPTGRRVRTDGEFVLVVWTTLSIVGFALSTYRASAQPGALRIPAVVPSYHYMLYATAAGCIWFGRAVSTLVHAATAKSGVAVQRAAVVGVAAGVLATSMPSYRHRFELTTDRAVAQSVRADLDNFAVTDWIQNHTAKTDVILYTDGAVQGLMITAPSGRRTVVVNEYFSNPYVDWSSRQAASEAMRDGLDACSTAPIRDGATRFGNIRYVLHKTAKATSLVAKCPGAVAMAVSGEHFSLLEVVG
jgi:hypothetical protein